MTVTLKQAREQNIVPWDNEIWNNDHVTVFQDRFPVTPGHMLFVPNTDEPHMIHLAMAEAHFEGERLLGINECDGYNIGINAGRSAGQTVMYPHIHLIPRRHGDCSDPTGGVRGVIPGQANYRVTEYKNPTDK